MLVIFANFHSFIEKLRCLDSKVDRFLTWHHRDSHFSSSQCGLWDFMFCSGLKNNCIEPR